MVKKLTSEEFCSVAHRQAYQAEQEKMAVARLIEDQQRRRPVRRSLSQLQNGLEAPASANYLFEQVKPRHIGTQPRIPSTELTFHPATALPCASPELAPARNGLAPVQFEGEGVSPAGNSSVVSAMACLLVEKPVLNNPSGKLPSQLYADSHAMAAVESELAIEIEAVAPAPVEMGLAALALAGEAIRPSSGLEPKRDVGFSLDLTHAAGAQLPFDMAMRLTPQEPGAIGLPIVNEPSLNEMQSKALLPGEVGGLSEKPFPSAGIAGSEWEAIDVAPREHAESKPFRMGGVGAWLPAAMNWAVSGRRLTEAGMQEVSFAVSPNKPAAARLPRAIGAWVPTGVGILAPTVGPRDSVITRTASSVGRIFSRPQAKAPKPAKLDCDAATHFSGSHPPLPASPGTAKILGRTQGKCEVYDSQIAHPEDFLYAHPGSWTGANSLFTFHEPFTPKARIASVRRSTLNITAKTYRSSRLAGIAVHPDPGARQAISYDWQPVNKPPLIRPKLQLKPLAARTSQSALAGLSPFAGIGHQFAWEGLKRRWEEAPNDIRWIAMAVPIVIGLLWFSGSPAAQNGARGRLKAMVPDVQGWVKTSFSDDSLDGLKQNIQKRAAVELADDFRQGLGEWAGQGDWSRGWNYDPAGFIRPRQLALYAPSIFLEDYRFEFLGAIERKALSWVFRAADVNNYYAARLEVTRGGPLPTVELVRWAVINGKPGPKKSIPLPMQARMDTIYRVRVDVRGNDFVTTVQGQVVDVFTDSRLSRGGIGFFSSAGEDARLRWVEVSHQYDMLGRLCAYLVPYNVSNSNVRSAP